MLRPCRACNRHLHDSESRCPFCDVHAPLAGVSVLRAPSPRLSRAAQLAFCVTLAGASTAHCAGNVAEPDSRVPPPSPDATREAGAPDAGTAEDAMAQPDTDAGSDAASHPTIRAIYGDPTVRITEHIYFSLGKTTPRQETPLPPGLKFATEEFPTLTAIAEVIREHGFTVEIEGHADPTEKQPGVSLRRAKYVHDRLVRIGVDPARLKVVDRAATQPVVPSPSTYNARVSFRIIDDPARDGGRF